LEKLQDSQKIIRRFLDANNPDAYFEKLPNTSTFKLKDFS
jgi:hypothetical protein